MKRFIAIVSAVMSVACGSDSPTTPGNTNTGPIVLTAQLSAANEVPPIANAEANGRGMVTITLTVPRDPATGAVTGPGSATFAAQLLGFPGGTVVRNAHIHTGAAGVVGPVLVDTTLTAASPVVLDANGAGTLNLTNSTLTQLDAQNIVANPAGVYFNVHTALNAGGAVRGQLARQ